MANKAQSQGKQCAVMHCFSREYMIINGEHVSTNLKLFSFPMKDRARINQWCNLIKRRNDKDGFTVSKHTKIRNRQGPQAVSRTSRMFYFDSSPTEA